MVDYIEKQIENMEKMGADRMNILLDFNHYNGKKYKVNIHIQEDDKRGKR